MHPLMERGSVEAFQVLEQFLSTLEKHGLLPGEPVKHGTSVDEEELYHTGQRSTGRLIWGWLRRSDVGLMVKVVFQLNRDFLFVLFLPEQSKWIFDSQLSHPVALQVLRSRIGSVDQDSFDRPQAVRVVEIMARTFKETLLERRRIAN